MEEIVIIDHHPQPWKPSLTGGNSHSRDSGSPLALPAGRSAHSRTYRSDPIAALHQGSSIVPCRSKPGHLEVIGAIPIDSACHLHAVAHWPAASGGIGASTATAQQLARPSRPGSGNPSSHRCFLPSHRSMSFHHSGDRGSCVRQAVHVCSSSVV